MSHLTEAELLEDLSWRYATKKFDPTRGVPDATWQILRRAASLTPTSFGLEPYRLLEVRDPAVRQALKAESWNQTQVVDAARYVVFAIETPFTQERVDAYIARAARAREVPPETLEPYRSMMSGNLLSGPRSAHLERWAANQAYIALGGMLAAAAHLGVDSCPLEGLDPARYDEILGLRAKGLSTVCAAAFGHRASDDKYASLPKVRKSLDELFEVI